MPTIIKIDLITGNRTEQEMTGNDLLYYQQSQLTKVQKKNMEIKERTSKYKNDLLSLNYNWLSAAVIDGETETNKKLAILSDIEDLEDEYNTDITNIRLKYQ